MDEPQKDNEFYYKAKEYWANVKPTLDGVLGGFGFTSSTDIEGSNAFIKSLFKLDPPPGKSRALDCGAGIGRITKDLLVKHFDKVDLVDQDQKFIDTARDFIGQSTHLGNFYVAGLQEFEPEEKYDVIWIQWVLVHLTDPDMVIFLKKCGKSLTNNGLIVIKENIASCDEVHTDTVDSSVTRPLKLLMQLFNDSGLELIQKQYQKGFPKGLYRVIMMALRPKRT